MRSLASIPMMLRGERADGEAEKGCLEWNFFRVPDIPESIERKDEPMKH